MFVVKNTASRGTAGFVNQACHHRLSLELEQIDEYEAFKDQGFKAAPPPGYKRIRVHMVYAIKQT